MPAGGSPTSATRCRRAASHNTVIEILWTVVPVLILVIIAIPSFKLLYFMDRVPHADMTIKVTGHQWYWTYEYPDNGNFTFDSNMIADSDLKPGQLRLLEVDNPLVVPVGDQRPRADHRHRRDPQLVHAAVRRAGRRGARPPQRDLDQGRASPAPITASAPRSAASTTASCRSRCEAVTKPEFDAWLERGARRNSPRADERSRSPVAPASPTARPSRRN